MCRAGGGRVKNSVEANNSPIATRTAVLKDVHYNAASLQCHPIAIIMMPPPPTQFRRMINDYCIIYRLYDIVSQKSFKTCVEDDCAAPCRHSIIIIIIIYVTPRANAPLTASRTKILQRYEIANVESLLKNRTSQKAVTITAVAIEGRGLR